MELNSQNYEKYIYSKQNRFHSMVSLAQISVSKKHKQHYRETQAEVIKYYSFERLARL